MAYSEYRVPGVDVLIEQLARPVAAARTAFLPVFVGMGATSRNRVEQLTRLKANFANYPTVVFEYPAIGNTQLFDDTDFSLSEFKLHKEIVVGTPLTNLVVGTDIEILSPVEFRESSLTYRTTIKVLNQTKITRSDLYFNFKVTLENTDEDFVPRLLTTDERFEVEQILGPKILKESGLELRNDLAFAAEIAFRLGTEQFYYIEVPRDFGEAPTKADFQGIIEEIFFVRDIYRIVPLTYDIDVIKLVSSFTTSVSNPNDKRQLVTFFSTDPALVTDTKDIGSWIDSVGTFSESINNRRAYNVAGITEIELAVDGLRFDLPLYFLAAAVAAFDSSFGMSKPISTEVIDLFSRVKGPRFRPKIWGNLARYGVFVCYKTDIPTSEGVAIHHQLSTAQSEAAEDQELSVVKNVDGATVRLRDWFAPYAGRENIDEDLLVKLEATTTQAIEDITKNEKFMSFLEVTSPWSLRQVPTTNGIVENRRNLVTRFSGLPMYPANNLDIILSI